MGAARDHDWLGAGTMQASDSSPESKMRWLTVVDGGSRLRLDAISGLTQGAVPASVASDLYVRREAFDLDVRTKTSLRQP
jgi:hypothetical protein